MDKVQLQAVLDKQKFPKVTEDYMKSRIKDVAYHRLTPVMTVAVITLDNGYTVTGTSACVSPENYNKDVGETIAYNNAFNQLWPLFGFLLAEDIFQTTSAT